MAFDGTHRELQPPRNEEVEQALLAAILVQNAAYEAVADFLRPEHFYLAVHGRIYAAAAALIGKGETANPVTLKSFFEDDPALADMGGWRYLSKLAVSVVTFANSADYGRQIVDLWERRAIILACRDTEARAFAFSLTENATDILAEHDQALYSIGAAA